MSERPEDQAEVREKAAEALAPAQAYQIARKLLSAPAGKFCTKAEPGADLLELPQHDGFEQSRFSAKLGQTTSLDDLLELEERLMVQLERIDALERALGEGAGSASELEDRLGRTSEALDALFDDMMATVKKEDRDLERTVASLNTFLAESRIGTRPDLAKHVYVLNADPDDLASSPEFGSGEHFGPVTGLHQVHKNVYGLWVLGTRVASKDAAAAIGSKALAHTAMAVMNLDAESMIGPEFRRDSVGDAMREQNLKMSGYDAEQAQAEAGHPSPLTERDLAWVNDCVGDVEGLERSVLCFSPLRVREASRYEQELGDVTVPSSYAYGGKIAFVSMVSGEEGVATAVSQAKKKYAIQDYMVRQTRRGDNGPFLYDHEGHVDKIPQGVVAGISSTGSESEAAMQQTITHFTGLHTARGGLERPEYQVSTSLAYDYLRRLMTVVARGRIGEPQANQEQIRSEVEELLQANLMSTDDPRKPFTSIRVINDTESHEGQQAQAAGGIRLVVEVGAKTAIPKVWVEIRPNQDGATGADE